MLSHEPLNLHLNTLSHCKYIFMRKVISILVALFSILVALGQAAKPTNTKTPPKADTSKTFKDWKEVLKDTRPINGFIQAHLKRDNTLYFELDSSQLKKDFGMTLYYSHGPSEITPIGVPALWGTRLMRFYRYGDQIALVHYNEKYTAPEGSSMKYALETGIGHSILAMFKIESENKENKHFLIDVSPFFASDYVNNGQDLKWIFDNKPVSYEKEKSFVEKIKGFPRNVEIEATISYRTSDPPIFPLDVVADTRFISVGIRYSLFALPDQPMKPRLADDRVGHFMTVFKDYSRDKDQTPYLRYVDRWRLEKKDPNLALSEPVKPIVFYIHNSIPEQYRKYVKEGIEAWNKGFEKAGFIRAIVAKEQPADSNWSAEDIRYSTIRWVPDPFGWAIGPHEVDPRTGEILNADILVASSVVNYYHEEYHNLSPQTILAQWEVMNNIQKYLTPEQSQRFCMAQMGMQQQLNFQNIMLSALDRFGDGKEAPEKFVGDAIRDLVMHEVGHTLGMRHNFKASSGIPYEKLNDTAFTRKNGLSLSVMDYTPVNIANDPKQQGYYWNAEIGEYDVWAIEYAYLPAMEKLQGAGSAGGAQSVNTAEDEQAMLRKIAARSNEPLHTYGTDEDNWLGWFAVDPLTNAFELSSNPGQFAADRDKLIGTVLPVLENRLIREGEDYHRLRNAFENLLFTRFISYFPICKTIGGLYFKRNHKGDPDEKATFTPVPAAQQREAVAAITSHLFAENAFIYDPKLLNNLAPNRYSHWGVGWGNTPVDFALLENVNDLQTIVLSMLIHPVRFQRMLNNELRMPAGESNYSPSEFLQSLSSSIWSELKTEKPTISIMRKNLQSSYTNQLIRLYAESPSFMVWSDGRMTESRVPSQIRALARLELSELAVSIGKVLKPGSIDRDTRAHLDETKARVEKVLASPYFLPLK